jgi:tyrosine-protein phosphatase YwqE
VEMSYLAPPANLFETIAEIQVKGFVPILAHPERYKSYHNELDVYEKLKTAGCLFQVNTISLTNYYGKNVHESAVWLLRNNLIDFIGSDIHHMRHMEQINSLTQREEMMQLISPVIHNNQQLR